MGLGHASEAPGPSDPKIQHFRTGLWTKKQNVSICHWYLPVEETPGALGCFKYGALSTSPAHLRLKASGLFQQGVCVEMLRVAVDQEGGP